MSSRICAQFQADLSDNGTGRPVDGGKLADLLSRLAYGPAGTTVSAIVTGLRDGSVSVPVDLPAGDADEILMHCARMIQDAIDARESVADLTWFTREFKRQTGWSPASRQWYPDGNWVRGSGYAAA